MKLNYRKAIEPLEPYVPGRPIDAVKKLYNLDRVVKIASNENPGGCSPRVAEAVAEALKSTAVYPDGNCTRLREALAARIGVSPDMLVFGAGVDELISMACKVFIGDGDECVTGEVTFSQYEASVVAMGGKTVLAKMRDNAYDLDGLIARITPRTRLIFIANPNNPTGTAFFEDEQREFIKKVPENVIVVFDEAYAEYAGTDRFPKTLEYLKEYRNVILMKTFSKIYGLASLRVGYAAASPEIIKLFEKIRNPFNVSSMAQAAALAAIGDDGFVAESARLNSEVKAYFCGELDGMGVKYIPTYANFVLVKINGSSMEMFESLMRRGYIIRAGKPLGMEGWIRVTFGTMEEMKGFLGVLKELL